MALAKAEERQNRQDHDNEADEIDETVHGFLRMPCLHFSIDNLPESAKFLTLTGKRSNPPRAIAVQNHGLRSFMGSAQSPYLVHANISENTGMTGQLALFADEQSSPAGLQYVAEFIAPDLERELIDHVAALPLQPFQFGAFEGKRRVAWFGFRYDYTLQRLQPAEPIPGWLAPLIEKVEAHGGPSTRIGQVLCTEYDTGVGIGWHRDKPHFDRIFGLSLGASCKFRFRRPAGEKWQRYTLEAAPRSLYMISGEARRVWEHSIPAVEAPRYSITFRTMVDRKT
jgi:alkylated DNA repair dioxygenase AlkB